MLPKKLTIQGLYSYKTKQVIHFESLTTHHLFGIFGSVGSGKSSILDAITFALYNEIDRLNKNDNRSKNLFNQESDEFLIDFEFEAGAENQTYRFVVNNSRSKKGEPKLFDRQAYSWESNTWKPLGKITAESIFNLSYENFKRTIIIPQGKFQEFFSLTGGARTEMMMQLFPRLGEFDLFDKVGAKKKETEILLADFQGQLKQINVVDDEDLESRKIQIQQLETEIKDLQQSLTQLETMMAEMQQIKIWFQELLDAEKRILQLEPIEAENLKQKQELEEYELIFNAFESEIRLLEKTKFDWEKLKDDLQKIKSEGLELTEKIRENKIAVEELGEKELELPQWENQLKDWELVSKIHDLHNQTLVHQQNIKNLQAKMELIQQERHQKQTEKEELEKAIANLEAGTQNLTEILVAEQLLLEKERLKELFYQETRKLNEANEALEKSKAKKDSLLKTPDWKDFPQFRVDLKMKDILQAIAEAKDSISEEINVLNQKRDEILSQDHLFHFANQIKDGEPCPLCGSTHHPDIISATDVGNQRIENEGLTNEKSDTLKKLNQLELELTQIQTDVKHQVSNKTVIENQINKLESDQKLNAEKLKDNPFNTLGLEGIKKEVENGNQARENLKMSRDAIKISSEKIINMDAQLSTHAEQINELNKILAGYSGQTSTLEGQIKTLTHEGLQTISPIEIAQKESDLKKNLAHWQYKIEQAKIALEQSEKNWLTQQTREQQLTQQCDDLLKDLVAQKTKLEQTLNVQSLTEEKVTEVLSKKLDTRTLRTNLDGYFHELNLERQRARDAQNKLKENRPDEQKEAEIAEKLKQTKNLLSENQGDLGAKKSDWIRLNDDLKKSIEIRSKVENLKLRLENLSTLFRLFMNNGFVNFASSRYLNNILEMANERFFRMTKQRLRLIMDDQNNFLVKDYLNNGHERLAKTLSGGQTFQASLCLALALADSIGHITQSTRNFFFLDEGFGSLDKEALSMVFDTLRQLQNENRIVGVISHVEELQQEMPVYLQIKLTAEQGSIIELGG